MAAACCGRAQVCMLWGIVGIFSTTPSFPAPIAPRAASGAHMVRQSALAAVGAQAADGAQGGRNSGWARPAGGSCGKGCSPRIDPHQRRVRCVG